LASADVDVLLRLADTADMARDALLELLPQLVDTYGLAAGSLAADWYDEAREQVAVRGRFVAFVPDPKPETGEVLARWGVKPLYKAEPDWAAARTQINGGLQKRIADQARESVTVSSVQDPAAQGWQRVTSGKSCPFCVMLASRGRVFSESSADFASHGHCDCYAVPAWGGEPIPVKEYTPTSRNITDADRARTRRYLADHDAG